MNKNNKYYVANVTNVNKPPNDFLNKKKFNIDILFEKIIGNKTNISLLDNFGKYNWSEFI